MWFCGGVCPFRKQSGNPFFEVANLRPDFFYQFVCFSDIPVKLAFFGSYAFLLHLASRHAHMDGRDLVYPLPFIAAVVDTLRAVVSLQIGIGKVSPCRPPNFRIFLVVPVHKVNLAGLVSAAWQLHTLALFIKHIFLFGFRRPCAALVKGAHSQEDMGVRVAAACVMYGEVGAHSFGNKLRGTVFPDKP